MVFTPTAHVSQNNEQLSVLFLPCGFWRMNPNFWVCQQVLLHTAPSYQSIKDFQTKKNSFLKLKRFSIKLCVPMLGLSVLLCLCGARVT